MKTRRVNAPCPIPDNHRRTREGPLRRPLLHFDDSRAVKAGVLVLSLVLLASCSPKAKVEPEYSAPAAPKPVAGAVPWSRPPDTLDRARRAGLVPERKESFVFHIHAHLDVFVNGKSTPVPAGLGIDIKAPGVKSGPLRGGGTGYGGISLCGRPCISPLHTHDLSGIVHVEAPQKKDFTLGGFFAEWGLRLDSTCAGGYCRPAAEWAVFVGGKPFEGNPADIVFEDKQQIALVIGTPPAQIPADYGTPEV